MDVISHTPLSAAEHTETILRGAMVFDPDDNRIGTIARMNDHQAGRVAVIDVGGALMLGSGLVELPLEDLSLMRGMHGVVHAVTSRSRQEIEAMLIDRA